MTGEIIDKHGLLRFFVVRGIFGAVEVSGGDYCCFGNIKIIVFVDLQCVTKGIFLLLLHMPHFFRALQLAKMGLEVWDHGEVWPAILRSLRPGFDIIIGGDV